jgi:hypothetical protein
MTRKIIFVLSAPFVIGLLFWSLQGSTVHAAQAGPDEGLVIFHRANVMAGKAIRFNLEQDGRPVGQLLAGTTLEIPLAPGTYTFTVRAPSVDGMDYLTLNVEAGKTYSVEGEILWGWPAGRPKFGNVSESGVATQPADMPSASAPSAATATAAPASGPAAAPAAANNRPAMSADDAGRLGLRNFAGDWNLEIWSLASDGHRLEGSGVATGTIEGDNAIRIVIAQFESVEFPEAIGGGRVTISHESGRGFVLETDLGYSDEVLNLTGGYQADSNTYVFFLIGGASGQTATGIDRTSVRLEIRSLDRNLWEAATFAHVDGQSTQVQSSRFTRR